ncbi:hypothetical protein F8388_005293 [Cannabis sativa]|uniref:GATA-type domain-containing protein n=1 Tax=Cannabis sativa TaxID=3483 RepID=A0A7J6ELC6_CANSA|nr:hypothetical protein F8388_005293 [Cannabis sativa]KAF4374964.1 hypothetical protein G4B88_004715 [Cannabis sativa]
MIQKALWREMGFGYVDLTLRLSLPGTHHNNIQYDFHQPQPQPQVPKPKPDYVPFFISFFPSNNTTDVAPAPAPAPTLAHGVSIGNVGANASIPITSGVGSGIDFVFGIGDGDGKGSATIVSANSASTGVVDADSGAANATSLGVVVQELNNDTITRRNYRKRGLDIEEQVDEEDRDANRTRCSNRNCGTHSTPMWRRGPLGPKTLCNACGIKFRKLEERKAEGGDSD